MSVRWIRPEDALAADRESPIVCLVHDGQNPASSAAALAALVEHTAREIPLMLAGAHHRDELIRSTAGVERELIALEADPEAAISNLLDSVGRVCDPADLVLLDPCCGVPSGWVERLREAARSDGTVATASPLGSAAGAVGGSGGDLTEADLIVAATATKRRPRLLIGGPHCIYVRRRALDLIGGFSGSQTTLEAAIAAVSERCLAQGMVNVLADDLYVSCDPARRGGEAAPATGPLQEVDRLDERSPLRRSLALAQSALGGLSVTIDARSLGEPVAGTQRYTLELVLALARFTNARVRAVVGDEIAPSALAQLREEPGVEIVGFERAKSGRLRSHVVHRPQQVSSAGDLNLLALLGDRVVITHQDLIGYHNPSYHETLEAWERYRRITRIALAGADRVVFFSEHSRRDAEAEDLVTPERCELIGVALSRAEARDPVAPRDAPRDRDFILCLGADYRHKNRRFAIALAGALRTEQGWSGRLVLAGAHVPYGSSRADEEELLAAAPAVREAIVDLGRVTEPELAWLVTHARAVVVPSVVEGFGLVPLEAAEAGLPCLFAAQSSLVEVVDSSLATLVPWNASESAACVMPLLLDGPERNRHVDGLRASGQRWDWEQIARATLGCYEQAMRSPFQPASARAWQELRRETSLIELHQRHQSLLRDLGDGIALAVDDGFLTHREQRGLLRVGSRPAIARATLWPFALIGALRPGRRRRTRRSR